MFGDQTFGDLNLAESELFFGDDPTPFTQHTGSGNDDFLNILDDVGESDFPIMDQHQPSQQMQQSQQAQQLHGGYGHDYSSFPLPAQPVTSMAMNPPMPPQSYQSMMPPAHMSQHALHANGMHTNAMHLGLHHPMSAGPASMGMVQSEQKTPDLSTQQPAKPRRGRPPKNKTEVPVTPAVTGAGVDAVKPKARSRRQKLTPEEREARKQQRLIQRRLRKSAREKERRSLENEYFEQLAELVGLPPDQRDKATVLEAVIESIREENPSMSQEEMDRNLQNIYKLFGSGGGSGKDSDGDDDDDDKDMVDQKPPAPAKPSPASTSSMMNSQHKVKSEPMGPPQGRPAVPITF